MCATKYLIVNHYIEPQTWARTSKPSVVFRRMRVRASVCLGSFCTFTYALAGSR